MNIEFIDLKRQYALYKQEIDDAISNVLSKSNYINGDDIRLLEQELAEFCGANYVLCCSSGTSALEVALRVAGVKQGDEVITSSFSFIASASMIKYIGAKPVFVDIDKDTYNIDERKIQNALTNKTKAILAVSLFGQCAPLDKISKIIKQNPHLKLIEDGAQSFGAMHNNKRSCSLSSFATTSFFPAKPIGCYGDGGAVFFKNEDDYKCAKYFINHGQTKRYKHDFLGINGRMDTIQAAILRVKLKHFKDEISKREKIAKRYDEHLKEIVKVPIIKKGNKSVYAQYCIQSSQRDKLKEALSKKNIPIAIHYPMPLYKQNAFKDLNIKDDDFTISNELSKNILSIPMHPFLAQDVQDYIIEAIREALR